MNLLCRRLGDLVRHIGKGVKLRGRCPAFALREVRVVALYQCRHFVLRERKSTDVSSLFMRCRVTLEWEKRGDGVGHAGVKEGVSVVGGQKLHEARARFLG